MWLVREYREIETISKKLPDSVVKKCELKQAIESSRKAEKIRELPGLYDKKL